jgi:outer membrane protein insertion porin family
MSIGRVWVLLCFFLAGSAAWAQDQTPKVAVAPFVIHSQEKSPNIQKTIENLVDRQFRAEEIRTIDPNDVQRAIGGVGTVTNEEAARSLGRRLQAEYVLFGSFNQVGESISLDAKLVDTSGHKPTRSLFAEQKGMENLATAVKGIVGDAAVTVLSKSIIADVKVKGNERIEADAIKLNIKSKKGEVLRPEQVRDDIKAIYKMGYFEKVDADVADTPSGKVLTFVVKENPSVVEVKVVGNKKLKEKDILAAITTKPYTVLQKNVVSEDVQRIIKLYHQKGYFGADVTSKIEFPRNPQNAVVVFDIKEHGKIYIRNINFRGNKHFSPRKLRGVMQTKEKDFILYLFTDRGILQRDILDTDIDRLTVFYHDHGYMDAKVGTPEIKQEKDGFNITIPVDEGSRYKVAGVKVEGEAASDEQDILKHLESKPGEYFSREKLRKDIDYITKKYMNVGYAYAEVDPDIKRNPEKNTAEIAFRVSKGDIVHIGTIYITGNTKTRDKVIRREIKLAEGDTFDGSKMEKSITNLKKLDFFEDVEITPAESNQKDIMNLHVKVKEKLTGSVSAGGGYSSDDGLFATTQLQQRNLFGKGEYAALKLYFGQEAQRYVLSFTEPYLFDYRIAAGIDMYNWLRQYNDFTQDSTGFQLRASYQFGNYSTFNTAYTFENAKLADIDYATATPYILSQEGRHIKSSITLGVARDTTDDPFLPTKGTFNTVSVEYASSALGSDSDFIKSEFKTGWYFPIVWKFIGLLRGEFGYIVEPNGDIPVYEKFFLGGINNLRAWAWGDIGPHDANGEVIGGLQYAVLNAELLFPLVEKIGMRGVVFFDTGNAFDGGDAAIDLKTFDVSKFRYDVGGGIRWRSPLGPLRIEIGYNLDPKPGEDQYHWQFSAGAFF